MSVRLSPSPRPNQKPSSDSKSQGINHLIPQMRDPLSPLPIASFLLTFASVAAKMTSRKVRKGRQVSHRCSQPSRAWRDKLLRSAPHPAIAESAKVAAYPIVVFNLRVLGDHGVSKKDSSYPLCRPWRDKSPHAKSATQIANHLRPFTPSNLLNPLTPESVNP